MSDKIWVSARDVSTGFTYTVGGGTADELFENLVGIYGNPDDANKVLRGFSIFLEPPTLPVPSADNPASSAPSQGRSAPGAPSCEHGPRVWKDAFVSRQGKQMPSSWQCTSRDRNNQCKAIWNDS